jgi:hypothetical protein
MTSIGSLFEKVGVVIDTSLGDDRYNATPDRVRKK